MGAGGGGLPARANECTHVGHVHWAGSLGITAGRQNPPGRRVRVGRVRVGVGLRQPVENPYPWCGFRRVDGFSSSLTSRLAPPTDPHLVSTVSSICSFFCYESLPHLNSRLGLALCKVPASPSCDGCESVQFKTLGRISRPPQGLQGLSRLSSILYW